MDRKPRSDAAASSHRARWAGCRQRTGAWSSSVGSETSSAGRQSSAGGVSAGSVRATTTASVTSVPPGACSFAVAVPVTRTVVSSGGTSVPAGRTTCARPLRSRSTRKVTRASSRRRCTQPSRTTALPGEVVVRSAQRVRPAAGRGGRAATVSKPGSDGVDGMCPPGGWGPGGVGGGKVAVPPHLRRRAPASRRCTPDARTAAALLACRRGVRPRGRRQQRRHTRRRAKASFGVTPHPARVVRSRRGSGSCGG